MRVVKFYMTKGLSFKTVFQLSDQVDNYGIAVVKCDR